MLFRKLKVLSDDEMVRIIETSFKILDEIGCAFEDEACMNELEAVGCEVDRGSMVVKFTEDVIFNALDSVRSVTPPDELPKARVCSANKGMILDYEQKAMRRGATQDAKNAILLCGKLDNITLASAGVVTGDVHNDAVEVFNTALLMKYSEKLFNQWVYNPDNVPYVIEMAKVVTGGEQELRESQYISYMLNSITPLRFPVTQLSMTRMYTKMDLPIAIGSLPQSASTAPGTMAGSLAICMAELIAGLVWIMSLNTKSGVALGAFTQIINMKTAEQLYAGPEQTLMFLGAQQLIRYLGYTSGNTAFETDTPDFDMQCGWEKALSGVLSWAAGFDMLGQAGFLKDGFSPELLVLDNEAMGMLMKVAEGVTVDEETLAFDCINAVGSKGNFLEQRHTMMHARDFWLPTIFPRESYEQWLQGGMKQSADLAHERVKSILSENELQPQLTEDQAKEIDEIVNRRLAEVGASRMEVI